MWVFMALKLERSELVSNVQSDAEDLALLEFHLIFLTTGEADA